MNGAAYAEDVEHRLRDPDRRFGDLRIGPAAKRRIGRENAEKLLKLEIVPATIAVADGLAA